MNEIEIKAKVPDFEVIKEKLVALDCEFSEPLIQKDRIYLHNSIEFPEIKKGDVVLRIRDSNGVITMTLKKHLDNELACIEREVVVDKVDQAEDILKYMAFHEVIGVVKKRIRCKYQDMEICLDDVERLGSFIEVERLTEEDDGPKVQDELFEFLETLGIKEEDKVVKGYDTLLYELDNK